MAANSAFPINIIDPDTGNISGSLSISPLRDRNGIYEYQGKQTSGTVFSADPSVRITASVRPGTSANYISKVPRVKRRVTLKIALPVDVPGETGTIVDFINLDVTLSSPNEATEMQIRAALASVEGLAFSIPDMPLRDLLVNGREPY